MKSCMICYLKDDIVLDFDGLCTTVDYSTERMCVFKNASENKEILLAIVPYENILYIKNSQYRAVT